jgi:hypothetical protein
MATSDPKVPPSVNAAPLSSHDPKPLSGVEASKRRAAYKAVEDHFDNNYRYIGIGSGSTVVYVVEAIAARGRAVTSRMIFVPTYEIIFYDYPWSAASFSGLHYLTEISSESSSSDTIANFSFAEAINPNS